MNGNKLYFLSSSLQVLHLCVFRVSGQKQARRNPRNSKLKHLAGNVQALALCLIKS